MFFKLPPELRSLIYEYVAFDSVVVGRERFNLLESDTLLSAVQDRNLAPGLLTTCKQTRDEYLPIMCAHAHILLPVFDWRFDDAIEMREKQPINLRRALRANEHGLAIAIQASGWTDAGKDILLKWLDYRLQEQPTTRWDYFVEQPEEEREQWHSPRWISMEDGRARLASDARSGDWCQAR